MSEISSCPDKPVDRWFGPAIFLFSFVVIFAIFLWFLRENTHNAQKKVLVANAELVGENMRMRLGGDRDYLLMIAKERGDGFMDAGSFQERASHYVRDHPGMICINWVDADYLIIDVAPIAPNRQIVGLRLNLPEPKRASRLAMERREPVYTHPFEVIQGELAFEIWVPVFHDDVFLGLFGGIYSYEKMLRSLAGPQMLKTSNVSVVDAAGKFLLQLPPTGTVDEDVAYQVPMPQPEIGTVLRFKGYGWGPIGWGLLALGFLCLALVLGMVYAMWGLRCEIEVRRRAEEALRRLNRELRAISNCNQVLVRAEDEQTLLNEICRIVCDEAGYRMVWVGYAENDEAKTVRPVAWAGFESGYIANARLTWADGTERGQGPAGKVIRSGEKIHVQDFTTDPLMAPWRESAMQHGYRSGMALPLKDDSAKVFGVLLIYSAEANAITPEEIRLMEELSG
ncbi:MAG: GAF domain-containing protein, partial [Myxococcota bacterium]